MSWGTCFALSVPLPTPPKSTWNTHSSSDKLEAQVQVRSVDCGSNSEDSTSSSASTVDSSPLRRLPLQINPNPNPVVDLGSDDATVTLECLGTGLFSPSYGRNVLTRSTLIGKESLAILKTIGEEGNTPPSPSSSTVSTTSTNSTLASQRAEGESFESACMTHTCSLQVSPTSAAMFSSFLMPPAPSTTTSASSSFFYPSSSGSASSSGSSSSSSSSGKGNNGSGSRRGDEVSLSLLSMVCLGPPAAQVRVSQSLSLSLSLSLSIYLSHSLFLTLSLLLSFSLSISLYHTLWHTRPHTRALRPCNSLFNAIILQMTNNKLLIGGSDEKVSKPCFWADGREKNRYGETSEVGRYRRATAKIYRWLNNHSHFLCIWI